MIASKTLSKQKIRQEDKPGLKNINNELFFEFKLTGKVPSAPGEILFRVSPRHQ